MAYTEQTWADGSGGGTPISAARLTHIEDGSGGGTPISAARLTHIEDGIAAVDVAKTDKAANLSDLASLATAKVNLGINNVSNTSDASKPVSTAAAAALAAKADLVSGKTTIAQAPAGSEFSIYCVAGVWPARPTSRTDVTINYRASALTDPDPTDFIADKDYLYRETS